MDQKKLEMQGHDKKLTRMRLMHVIWCTTSLELNMLMKPSHSGDHTSSTLVTETDCTNQPTCSTQRI